MKNVTRHPIPKSLSRNAKAWAEALSARIQTVGDVKLVEEKYFNKYGKKDVREALENMYDGLCCFCETRIKPGGLGNVEHRRPQRKFPEFTYDWDNLHWCCDSCNSFKGDEFDEENEILDAVMDVPVGDNFEYKFLAAIKQVVWFPTSPKGKTTCKHVKINRHELEKVRFEVCISAMQLLGEIRNYASNLEKQIAEEQLSELEKLEYGSIITWARNTYS